VKIEDQPDAPKIVTTVRGMGYRLIVSVAGQSDI